MPRTRINVGDVFEIPIAGRRRAYCQYVAWNEQLGFLVRVLDRIDTKPLASLDELRDAKELFPAVFVGLRATVRSGRWRWVGNFPVAPFEFPRFRSTLGVGPGVYEDWWVWDGTDRRYIGALPANLRSLEMEVVWGDEALEERIASGSVPFAGMV